MHLGDPDFFGYFGLGQLTEESVDENGPLPLRQRKKCRPKCFVSVDAVQGCVEVPQTVCEGRPVSGEGGIERSGVVRVTGRDDCGYLTGFDVDLRSELGNGWLAAETLGEGSPAFCSAR